MAEVTLRFADTENGLARRVSCFHLDLGDVLALLDMCPRGDQLAVTSGSRTDRTEHFLACLPRNRTGELGWGAGMSRGPP